jgi:nucleotide-binding universal stress UspA family protein
MFRHILIPTDGSNVSAKAVKAGIAFAKEVGAKVTGYYALHELQHLHKTRYGKIGRELSAELERRSHEVGERHLAAIRKAAKRAGVKFEALVTTADSPYEGIIKAAKKHSCDIIFMASRGRPSLKRLFIGSVTQQVLMHSKIPVLVFR